MKAVQQIALIELERLGCAAGVERLLEGNRIAPEVFPVQPQLIAVAGNESLRAQRAAKKVYGLTQCVSSVIGIELGPEQGDQGIASVGTMRTRQSQIRQEG